MKPLALTAIAVSVLIGWSSFEAYQNIESRIYDQRNNMAELRELKSSYTQLSFINQQWKDTFFSGAEIPDERTAIRRFNFPEYNLSTNAASVQVEGRSDYPGLYLLCMKAGSANRVTVTSPDIDNLLTGLEDLAARQDITFTGLQIRQLGGHAEARLEKLCMHVRTDT